MCDYRAEVQWGSFAVLSTVVTGRSRNVHSLDDSRACCSGIHGRRAMISCVRLTKQRIEKRFDGVNGVVDFDGHCGDSMVRLRDTLM